MSSCCIRERNQAPAEFEVEMERISSFEELYEVMSNLHDCPFELDEAIFDEAAATWRGTFFRPMWEHREAKHTRSWLVFGRSEMPVAEASVRFRGVTDVQVIDDQGIGRYTLYGVERIPDGVRLCSNQAMRIDLHLAGGIEATYDEGELLGVCAVYHTFLSMETGPVIVAADATGDPD